MSSVQIGPKIGVEGEREYRQQVNNLITQAKTFSSEMRELESSFDKSTSAMEKNRKKTELLNKQVKNQKKLVDDLEKGLSEAKETFGDNATQTLKWEQALNNAKTELNRLNTELKNMPSQLTLAGDKMKSVGQSMQNIGGTLTKYVSVPLAAVGAASIKMAADAETSFAKVNTIVDHSVMSYEELTEGVIKASNETGVAVVDFNEALYSTISAGVDTGNAIQFTTDAVKLAKGGFTDTEKAVDVLTTVMNAYGLSAEDATAISDKLITTQNEGKTTVDELAGSLGRVIPTAKNANVDFDNVATALAVMTKHGISTNEATTYLNAMLGELNKTGSTTDKILREKTGMSFKELMDAGVPLTEVLQILDQAAQDDGKSLSDLFSQQNAGKAALTIMSDAGAEFNETLDKMAESSGATAEAFDTITSTSAEQFNKALNELKNLGIELGTSLLESAKPALETIGDVVKKATTKFNSLTDGQKETLVKLGLFATAAGPAVTALGTVVEAAGSVVGALGAIPEAAALLSSVGGPAALAVAAVLLVKAGIDASKDAAIASCDGLKESMEHTAEAAGALRDSVGEVKETIESTNETVAEINKKSNTAEALIDELYKLESQSNKTVEQQARMKAIVGELNALYPDLGLEIDGATGKLNKSKDSVTAYVEEAKNFALVMAYTKGLQEAYDKMAQAEMDLVEAREAQAEALDAYTRAYHDWYEAHENTPLDFSGQHIDTEETEKLWAASEIARTNLEKMRDVVKENEKAVEDAREETGLWRGQLEELTATTEESTEKTGENTATTKENSAANEENAESVEEATEAEEEHISILEKHKTASAGVGDAAKSAAQKIKDSAAAAQKEYAETAKAASDSIQKQIGLFDEFQKKDGVTIDSLKKNAESRRQAIQNYAENLQKLIQWAEESGDESAKAYVQAIAEMGVGAATEVEVLANSADEDLRFLAEQNYEAVVSAEFAGEQAAYAANDFRTVQEAEFEKSGKTIGGKIASGIKTGLATSEAKKQIAEASKGASTEFTNNSDAAVRVKRQEGADKAGQEAGRVAKENSGFYAQVKGQSGAADAGRAAGARAKEYSGFYAQVKGQAGAADAGRAAGARAKEYSGFNVKVTGQTGAKAAGQAAASTARENSGFKAKCTGVTGAAEAGRSAALAIKNAAGTVAIAVKAKLANGGFVNSPTNALIGEAGPEVVIPLSESRRARGLTLYEQAGEILGATANETPSVDLPEHNHTNDAVFTARTFGLDLSELYETVANAAMAGMQAANIKVYWDNREAGRIMRDMGVQFA